MICISCVFSNLYPISLSRYIYYCPNVIKKKEEEEKKLLRKKNLLPMIFATISRLLHTYIGHDLISRTASLHTYSSRSKIYCNVLIKLYHTTAHHRKKKQKRKKICHQKKSKHIFCVLKKVKNYLTYFDSYS